MVTARVVSTSDAPGTVPGIFHALTPSLQVAKLRHREAKGSPMATHPKAMEPGFRLRPPACGVCVLHWYVLASAECLFVSHGTLGCDLCSLPLTHPASRDGRYYPGVTSHAEQAESRG